MASVPIMTLKEKAVELLAVIAAYDEGSAELKTMEATLLNQFTFRPCARNVTLLRKHMVDRLCETDEELSPEDAWTMMVDIWDSVCSWAEQREEFLEWVPHFVKHLPSVKTEQKAVVETARRPNMQAARYTIKLDSYDGKKSGAAIWYRNVKLTMDTMKIPEEERYPMWQGLLTGQAKVEHHLHLQDLRREGVLDTVNVEVFVNRLIEKFDIGQHEHWLEKLRWIKQTRSEDYFVFELFLKLDFCR